MKIMNRRLESGSAMLLAIIALVLMAGIGSAIFTMALSGQKTTMAASNADAAFHVAEAGVDDAINKMKAYYQATVSKMDSDVILKSDFAVINEVVKDPDSGKTYNKVSGEFKGGSYSVTIEPPFAGIGDYKITSTGVSSGETRGVITYISAEEDSGVFKYGLFGDVYFDAGGTIQTDGYDSSVGTYASQAVNPVGKMKFANKTGHIGSNGSVDISGSSIIYGNATPGPKDVVTGGGTVYGSTTPAKAYLSLPDTDFTTPAGTTNVGALSKTTTLTSGTYSASSLKMASKATLTIKGDVVIYVAGDIDITGQAKVSIPTGSSLTIYQSGSTSDFKFAGGSTVNQEQLAANMKIYSNAASGTLTGNADLYASVYAPKTAIKITGTSGLFGSTIAKTIDIQGTPFFHYDETLGGMKSATVSFAVKAVEQFIP